MLVPIPQVTAVTTQVNHEHALLLQCSLICCHLHEAAERWTSGSLQTRRQRLTGAIQVRNQLRSRCTTDRAGNVARLQHSCRARGGMQRLP